MVTQILSTIGVMFTLVFVGMLIRHIKIVDKGFAKSLSNLLILVTFPALIFYSTISQFTKEMIPDTLVLVIFGALTCFLGYAIGLILSSCLHLKGPERSTFLILCAFGNTTFLSIPIGFALYGTDAIMGIILFDLGCNVLLWTFGIWLISPPQNNKLQSNPVKNVLNPSIVVLIVGLGVAVTGLKLPKVLTEACGLLGTATIPMALIATGSLLHGVGFRPKARWRTLIALTVGKLIAVPLSVILILSIIDLSASLRNIIVLEAAMPSMVLGTILAEKYGSDSNLAASGVFLTTLISTVTIPIFLSLS